MNANIEARAMQMHVVSRGHLSVADARQYLEAEAATKRQRRRYAAVASVFIATIAAIVAAFI